MTVFVDDVRHKFGNMIMCHLWTDGPVEELLEFVDTIGVQRKWIQGHKTLSFGKHREASWVHFDISISKKALALKAGAILTDKYGPVEHTRRLQLAWAEKNGDGAMVLRCLEWLETIEELRNGV